MKSQGWQPSYLHFVTLPVFPCLLRTIRWTTCVWRMWCTRMRWGLWRTQPRWCTSGWPSPTTCSWPTRTTLLTSPAVSLHPSAQISSPRTKENFELLKTRPAVFVFETAVKNRTEGEKVLLSARDDCGISMNSKSSVQNQFLPVFSTKWELWWALRGHTHRKKCCKSTRNTNFTRKKFHKTQQMWFWETKT